MNVALWVVQVLLALTNGFVGVAKLTQPKEKAYEQGLHYVEDFTQGQLRLIGVAEALAAVGLILPWALNIAPVLTPLAAVGVILVQLGAVYTHFRRGETKMIPVNLVLIALAVFVAWGRFINAV